MTWIAVTVPTFARRGCTGIDRGFDRTDFAANDRGNKPGIDPFIADQSDVRCFDHRVGRFDHRDQTHTFDHS